MYSKDRPTINAAAAVLVAVALCVFSPAAEAADNPALKGLAQKTFTVKVTRGRLSVSADDTPFGAVIDKVAKEAGFEVAVSSDIAAKTLSTSFRDIDLERGIQRLMGLISHRNFFIYYGRDGEITKLEVYGKTAIVESTGTQQPSTKDTGSPKIPQQPMIMEPMINEPAEASSPVATPKRPIDVKNINGVPYIPPASAPEYIPPHRGINKKRDNN